ncbi:hypothetical protein NUSPORA_00500 [Nucleospora cyclopteri]
MHIKIKFLINVFNLYCFYLFYIFLFSFAKIFVFNIEKTKTILFNIINISKLMKQL